jgi:hypothetical protein
MRKNLLWKAGVLIFINSCSGIPYWVKGPLSFEKGGYMYAVGYHPPTLFPADAIKFAQTNAKSELAKIAGVRIVEIIRDAISKEGGTISDSLEKEIVITVENEIEGLEPQDCWIDKEGKVREKGGAFCIVRIEKSKLFNKVKEEIHK